MILYAFASLIGLVFLYIKWKQSYWKRNNVAYIEPDFLFGNTAPITKQTDHRSKLFEKFYTHFKSKGHKFGGIYDFLAPVLIVTDLELIKNVLQKDFNHFINHEGYINEKDDPITGNLFNLKDEKWRNMRSKLTPTFTTGKMKMMFETMAECTTGLHKILDGYAAVSEPVDIKKTLLLFTTDIISSVAFGLDVKSMENPNTDFRKYFAKVFQPSLGRIIKRFLTLTVPHWILVKFRMRVTNIETEKFFYNVVKDIVEYREKNNIFRKDFIHLLIQIKNMGEIRDDDKLESDTVTKHLSLNEMTAQCVTFYVAGFETSATTMSFLLLELSLNMNIQEKLREEIQTVMKKYNNQLTYDGIMEMKYLEQVMQETLRKDSPASSISRICNKSYQIPDTDVVIEPGTEVVVPTYGLHNDPEYFPNPDKFDPERFSADNKNNIPSYAYVPFGEGPRACIGLRFGKLQSKVGVCAIISNYRVTLNKKTQLPIEYATSRIPTVKGGLWLTFEKL